MLESPGSCTTRTETVKGLPQIEPKSTLEPSNICTGISDNFE